MPTSRRRGPAGITITYAPDIATGCVADLAFGLVIGAARGFGRHARTMRERSWQTRTMGEGLGTRVWGKTMGMIGFGRIGRAFAHRCRGFGMRVVYHDLRRAADQIEHGAVFYPDLEGDAAALRLRQPAHAAQRLDAPHPRSRDAGAAAARRDRGEQRARRIDRRSGADRAAGVRPSRRRRGSTCSSRSRPSIRASPSSTTCS